MSFKIVLSNIVSFKVAGTINNEHGVAVPFDFVLKCRRMDGESAQAAIDSGSSIIDFLLDVVEGWTGPTDADDKPLEFSDKNLRALCKIANIGRLIFRSYLAEIGAKEKN